MSERIATKNNIQIAMGRIRHLHFVGIGGIGMSGIAEVFFNLGFEISGSDRSDSVNVRRMKNMGIKIVLGHSEKNLEKADVVVVSSAIDASNPELIKARDQRIPIVPRAAMLAELMRFRYGIAVSGTHGKTTTTSLVASLLAEGGMDPTFIIGGKLNSAGSNARLGDSHYLVAEADESDASFLLLQPMIAIVTNIDEDHMSTYNGDFAKLLQTFQEFLQHLPFYGLAVICIDDPRARDIIPHVPRPVVTYGLSEDADIRATNIRQVKTLTSFTVARKDNENWLNIELDMPGTHNVQNALAAITVASELGVAAKDIVQGLKLFQGVARRFQLYEHLKFGERTTFLVDDYAHHPREIAATLDAIRAGWPGKRIILIFQPHRFSRTRDLFEDFTKILSELDVLLLLDVYPAGELVITGADSRALIRAIRLRGKNEPVYVESTDTLFDILPNIIKDDDIVITMGAGDIGNLPAKLVARFCA